MNLKDSWRMILLVVIIALIGGAISSQLFPGRRVTGIIGAKEILFRDQDNQVRLEFVLGVHGEPGVALYDKAGLPRATLGLASDGEPRLNFLDENGKIFWSVP